MESQDDVKVETVEETTVTESSPVEAAEAPAEAEQTTESTEETPASESTEPEQVSKDVFLARLNKETEKRKVLEEKLAALESAQAPVTPQDIPELDPDAAIAVRNLIEKQLADQKVLEFRAKHGAKLDKDEMLSIAVEREMRKQSKEGLIIDPEKALQDAETLLNERMKPAQEQAKAEGVKEGQDVAKLKQQLGAVGNTAKVEEKDDASLSSAEYAKKYNIPYTPGY